MSDFDYFETTLESIVRYYIETTMKKKDWEVIAIDLKKGVVVLRRLKEKSKK